MKLTNTIKDTDHIELPVYVNGSFAERIIMTGIELKRLIDLVSPRVETTGYAVPTTELAAPKEETQSVGDATKEVRKEAEPQVGDDAAEKRGE